MSLIYHGIGIAFSSVMKRPETYWRIRNVIGGTRWRSWLRHYAINWKVTVSIFNEVIGFTI
jgi:hypothetical protein